MGAAHRGDKELLKVRDGHVHRGKDTAMDVSALLSEVPPPKLAMTTSIVTPREPPSTPTRRGSTKRRLDKDEPKPKLER